MKCLVALGLVATLFGANADAAQPPFDSKLKAFLQGYARSTPLPADQTLRVSVATVDPSLTIQAEAARVFKSTSEVRVGAGVVPIQVAITGLEQ